MSRLTTERITVVIVFVMLFAMAARIAVDTDMWWHLRLGQHVLAGGEPIYADSFSHTFSGVVHKNHSAAAQTLMYAVWALGGQAGLILFTAAGAVAGMYCLYRAGQGTIYMQGFVLILGAASAAVFWSPRPQLLSFLFAALLVFLLFDFKHHQRQRLWLIAPLIWLWGNAHGGFVIGFAILAAFIVGELLNGTAGRGHSPTPPAGIRQLVWTLAASAALLPLNPNGLGIYALPFETLGLPELRRFIQEWQPPDFSLPLTWGFLALLIMTIAAVWASPRKFDFTEGLLLGGALLMALTAGRHLSLFAVAAAPIATRHLDSILKAKGWTLPPKTRESPRRVGLNLLILGLVTLGALAKLAAVIDPDAIREGLSAALPVDAVAHLNSAALAGNMFNSYNWGGYLIFHAPRHPVYIDGRSDLYRGFINDYFRTASGAEGWRGEFEKWDIRLALIETESGLARQLAAAEDWRRTYQDKLASIFVKADFH